MHQDLITIKSYCFIKGILQLKWLEEVLSSLLTACVAVMNTSVYFGATALMSATIKQLNLTLASSH